MKGKKDSQTDTQENVLVIDIRITHGLMVVLVIVLLTASLVGYLAWGSRKVSASSMQAPQTASTGLRKYYATDSIKDGSQALTACAAGYHMASLWEIMDPSNLEYNTALGWVNDDSGEGPPTYDGWVRTGYEEDASMTPGKANCNLWTSTEYDDWGTAVKLAQDWSAGQDIHVWVYNVSRCENHRLVWCIED
jgi:hypothetical protein